MMKNKKAGKTSSRRANFSKQASARPATGLYYADSANVLCLVYPDGSSEKIYLGGGSKLMDLNLGDLTWYEGFGFSGQGWEYVGEL